MLTATVLIVGAGPVGMWLALELRRAAIDVLVIDTKTSRDDRDRVSKALTVSAGTLDTFHSRGLAPALLERSIRVPRAHFGGLPTTLELNGDVLGVAHPYNLAIPQSRTEAILLAACEKAGVRFAWGLRFARLVQSSRRDVVATAEVVSRTSDADHDPTSSNKAVSITAHWLVGCDGTHSAVRNAVGVPFEGLPHLVTGILADVILTEDPSDGGAPMTIRQGAMGSCIAVKIDGELHRVVGLSKTNRHKPASEELALDEVKDHLRDVFGSDLGAHSPAWMSRFGSACRVAASFRSGRVLLAGDAAHQFFPAGGQGLNLGIQDATNLAWKLVAACREEEEEKAGNSRPEVVDHLLDSYDRERRSADRDVVDKRAGADVPPHGHRASRDGGAQRRCRISELPRDEQALGQADDGLRRTASALSRRQQRVRRPRARGSQADASPCGSEGRRAVRSHRA
ncbi:uncharacterized protein E0L32_010690 [Thyridium curvatum]|uniref:FAD-binding domain-containing protein n=1 Tax=Thyridium curvatum TaxID=1093900 RepID=A0A507ARS4_9PEZI|nr:uncharacterized protein E0L32_010690 [Thyridium curvatum]TPX07591.1 hypothetical protein E0L32_010690 [Thyridium curvatum]